MTKITKNDFDHYLKKQLKNPASKRMFDEYGKQLEVAYQILQLRKKKKVSQSQLAKKIGTTQSNVARMEAGKQNFSTDMLVRIASALGKELEVKFV
ncbi:MAG: Transcriptional regulator, XRE family [Candidatus Magasanikbacteria bacterium GW2011_GWA2_37_8]|uniref:Transcriptional regulator, XRE family n=1 Tax=Candidatus Magasanikbacteria bacterium GW2011_GWA2_37_8 TaxID=1619036 RepID=A0A0G0HNN6_9BACT|nr:MAG: Transcriptional regulator, XRE family [Candidatus Magasanikbacteria bacterium GW2011_GWA2_37_8]